MDRVDADGATDRAMVHGSWGSVTGEGIQHIRAHHATSTALLTSPAATSYSEFGSDSDVPTPDMQHASGAQKRPWTREEDQELMRLVKEHGAGRWAEIGSLFGRRTGRQCRERWFNHLSPDVRKGPWSPEEDRSILDFVRKYGHKWSTLAKSMPGRTDNAIKNHFNSTLSRRLSLPRSASSDAILTATLSSTNIPSSISPSPHSDPPGSAGPTSPSLSPALSVPSTSMLSSKQATNATRDDDNDKEDSSAGSISSSSPGPPTPMRMPRSTSRTAEVLQVQKRHKSEDFAVGTGPAPVETHVDDTNLPLRWRTHPTVSTTTMTDGVRVIDQRRNGSSSISTSAGRLLDPVNDLSHTMDDICFSPLIRSLHKRKFNGAPNDSEKIP